MALRQSIRAQPDECHAGKAIRQRTVESGVIVHLPEKAISNRSRNLCGGWLECAASPRIAWIDWPNLHLAPARAIIRASSGRNDTIRKSA
jgi:hypothetical protein